MNTKRKVTALIIFSSLVVMASNVAAQGELTGAWLLDMTNITFGVTFQDLRTYHAGGTMTETSSGFPILDESPAHGVWSRQGSDFIETFILFAFDSTKKLTGRIQVRGLIRLIGSDSLSISWDADFILLNGRVISNVATGVGTGRRIRQQTVTAVDQKTSEVPVNPSTTIRFEVPKASYVYLKVLDTLGREVRTLVDRKYTSGTYFQLWDGKDNNQLPAPTGVYFLRMNSGGYVSTKKMTLIK